MLSCRRLLELYHIFRCCFFSSSLISTRSPSCRLWHFYFATKSHIHRSTIANCAHENTAKSEVEEFHFRFLFCCKMRRKIENWSTKTIQIDNLRSLSSHILQFFLLQGCTSFCKLFYCTCFVSFSITFRAILSSSFLVSSLFSKHLV